jgi:hypothetical protein
VQLALSSNFKKILHTELRDRTSFKMAYYRTPGDLGKYEIRVVTKVLWHPVLTCSAYYVDLGPRLELTVIIT